jgi:hypothetical protein
MGWNGNPVQIEEGIQSVILDRSEACKLLLILPALEQAGICKQHEKEQYKYFKHVPF